MEYRVLPHGGEKVSVIGMGSSVIGAQPEKEIIATVRAAVDSGVNYFDMAGGHAAIFAAYGKALEGIRDKLYLQIHFGADYTSGEYGWTTELAEVKRSVAWQLENLQTDYIDVGFIHCLDEESDLAAYQANGVLDYVLDLKKQGVWVFGTAADGNTTLYNADLKGPAAIVIGSEGDGMTRLVAENCDFLVSIPMKGQISSLNASAAAAILLYEAVRQRS